MEGGEHGVLSEKAVDHLVVALVRLAMKDICYYPPTHRNAESARVFFRNDYNFLCDYYPGLKKIFDEKWIREKGDMKFTTAERWLNIIERDLPQMLVRSEGK